MARQVIERLLCDVHDGEVDAVRTVEFGLNGKFYEVDLCKVHADELEGLVQEWSDFVVAFRATWPGPVLEVQRESRRLVRAHLGKAAGHEGQRPRPHPE